MAKLTVYFKDKVVHSGLFENGIVHVGRDETNGLVIDSLAVAPVHAVIIIQDEGATIKQLADDFPILINGEKIKQAILNNNDSFSIGKHDIVFKAAESNGHSQTLPDQASDTLHKDVMSFNQGISRHRVLPDANLQVMNGKNIGKLIPLTNSITRLGHSGSGVVVIEKRKGAYFIFILANKGKIMLNNQALNSGVLKIKNHDVLIIDNTSLQFFQS